MLCALGLLVISAAHLGAQGTTATILGTVTDTSGAAVTGAAVQVRNVGNGLTQSATSDAQGRYRVADLGVGEYEVQAGQTGFSTQLHKGITLTVGSQNVVEAGKKVLFSWATASAAIFWRYSAASTTCSVVV